MFRVSSGTTKPTFYRYELAFGLFFSWLVLELFYSPQSFIELLQFQKDWGFLVKLKQNLPHNQSCAAQWTLVLCQTLQTLS